MLKTIVWSLALISLFAVAVQDTRAQSDEKKFEVGGQFSALRFPTRTITTSSSGTALGEGHATDYGFGGRLGYNFSKHFALEAEGNFFPRDREFDAGRKAQGLFGVKAGKRFDKVGLFAKGRPGFVRFEKGDYRQTGGCITVFPPPLACFTRRATSNFALDLGGVVEIYPSKRTIIRFDAGDTIVRLGARNVAALKVPAPGSLAPTFLVAFPVSAETTHNLQGSIGFGFRF